MNAIKHASEPEDFEYLRIILKRRRTVLLVSALGFALMAAYAFLSSPV